MNEALVCFCTMALNFIFGPKCLFTQILEYQVFTEIFHCHVHHKGTLLRRKPKQEILHFYGQHTPEKRKTQK